MIKPSSLVPMWACCLVLGLGPFFPAWAYEPPLPGSPQALTDWRHLARPLAGERRVESDSRGDRALPAAEQPGEYVLLEVEGAGVLEHLWIPEGKAQVTIEVDGHRLWQGGLEQAWRPAAEAPRALRNLPAAATAGRRLDPGPRLAPLLGRAPWMRRDPHCEWGVVLNPAPDDTGVLRFICDSVRTDPTGNLLRVDQVHLLTPPPPEPGWRECEEMPAPQVSRGLTADLPATGCFTWSGWSAWVLEAAEPGQARFALAVHGEHAAPTKLLLRGCLAPGQEEWQARVGDAEWVTLAPGKDDREVVEWALPLPEVSLPAGMVLEIACTAAPEQAARARLALDAWKVE